MDYAILEKGGQKEDSEQFRFRNCSLSLFFPDGDATLLDRTAVLMGSGISDGNVHNNYSVPAIVVGGKSLGIRGNRHVRYPKGTPLSNLMLGITDRYGINLDKFGNSNAAIDLTTL